MRMDSEIAFHHTSSPPECRGRSCAQWQSGRGLPHSKTRSVFQGAGRSAGLGVRQWGQVQVKSILFTIAHWADLAHHQIAFTTLQCRTDCRTDSRPGDVSGHVWHRFFAVTEKGRRVCPRRWATRERPAMRSVGESKSFSRARWVRFAGMGRTDCKGFQCSSISKRR
jgi:hypothetical protein